MKNLKALFLTAGFLLVLLTVQSVSAQPITAATPFEQLACWRTLRPIDNVIRLG